MTALSRLRAAAEAARGCIGHVWPGYWEVHYPAANFINVASPTAILALIARCEAAEKELEAARKVVSDVRAFQDYDRDADGWFNGSMAEYDRVIAAASEGKT